MTFYGYLARAVRRHFECEHCMVLTVLAIAVVGCVVGELLK